MGSLEIWRCNNCGFVWNADFESSAINYGVDYNNDNRHSTVFRTHLESRVDRIADSVSSHKSVELLEVGCGQGDFLAKLNERLGTVHRAVGFDPACRNAGVEKNIELYAAYFNLDSIKTYRLKPDIIISRHTIEHIARPVDFLSILRASCRNQKGHQTRLFLETPTSDWILREKVHHDLFYEHCSLFTPASLSIALEHANFQLVEISTCFGGQYLWAEALSTTPLAASAFLESTSDYILHWRKLAEMAHCTGPVFIWGAGAKGATFAQLIDPEMQLFEAVIDINPGKQGHFIGATGHPIRAPNTLADGLTPAAILIMNPRYISEIQEELSHMGLRPDLHCVH